MSEAPYRKDGIGAFDLGGKVAVVTGASRGLGRAIALGLAAAGARMVLGSRQVTHLASVVEAIRSVGGEAHAVAVDITASDQCKALVAAAIRHWDRIDILVCNAATNILGMAATMPDDHWERVIGTELSGYYYLARAAYPVMAAQKPVRSSWSRRIQALSAMPDSSAWRSRRGAST
jgi:dehydrogenase/reductase SDR family member 4